MNNRVLIIGTGWLGTPLGKAFISEGHHVYGTTTSPDKESTLEKEGITPILFDTENTDHFQGFPEVETIIITLPYRRSFSPPSIYLNQLQTCLNHLHVSPSTKLLFTSSTSIYDSTIKTATEEMTLPLKTDRQKTLQACEKLILSRHPHGIVYRLAGLFGPNREIGELLKGKVSKHHPESIVNLVHLNDVIQAIVKGVTRHIPKGIYNIVSPYHPKRIVLYGNKCRFDPSAKLSLKCVSNSKIEQVLGDLSWKDPRPPSKEPL